MGQPLGEIAAGAGAPAVPASPSPGNGDGALPATEAPDRAGPAEPPSPPAGDAEWPRITPVARRLALENGIDPGAVTGTGPGGIVRKPDVLAAARAPAPAAAPRPPAAVPVGAGEEAVPLRGPAAALAGYMDDSLSIPTATSFRTISVAVLDAQRRQINDRPEDGRALGEALLHPSDRLGDRPRGGRAAVHDHRATR